MKKYYNLNEGYLSKLDDNNETLISAVDVDNIDKYSKIEKDDKQSFEDFKTQYKGVIDMKCTQDYGNCEDKDLWEDCAKELFLTSKNYLLQGDEYKAPDLEKKTENKQLTESNDINVGDEYINDYGAKITILEPTKDGEYQFKVTNTKTGVEGDVLATRSMKHVLDMNGYKKVESKNSTDRYQLRKFPSEQEYKGEWGAYDTKEDKFVQKGSRYVMKAAIIDLNRKDSKTESKINDIIANKGILNEIKTFNDKTIRDSFLNMCELEQISIRNQIQVLQECRRLTGKEPLTENNTNSEYQYMLLDRLKTDCEYFLGNGNRNEKHLWAGSVDAQIKEMKKIWNSLKEKPEWLTMEDINNYEKLMKDKKAIRQSKNLIKKYNKELNTNLNESNIDKYNTIPEIKDRLREINKQLAYIRRRDSVSLSIGTEQEQEELRSEKAKLNGRLRKLRNNAVDMDKMTPEQQKEFKQRLKDLDLLDDDESNLQSAIQSYRNHYIQEFESYTKKEENNTNLEYNYMLLDRLKQDCEYFLGNGNGNEKQLWAKNINEQITKMKELYNSFADNEKPEWITMDDINNYEKEMKELKANKEKKTESTPEKRISKYKESDGSVLRGGWKEISDKEAEELAKQASIDDPTDVYYVEYNDIMDSSSDIRWYKGKSYTVDEIIEIRKKEKYALYKKMMQAELEEQYENERRKGRPSIKNQSKTESFKITDPRDKRRKLIVPDKIENVLKSSKFEEIKSAIKKHDGIISNPRIYVNDNKLGLNYSFTGFNDEEHMKVFSDLGFNDLDTISNGQLNGWGYSQYEAPINIEGIPVILSYSPGVRIISIEFDYPLKEDTADNEPFYRYDNQENFEKAKREYQKNPNEETLKAFKDARSAFEKEINAKKE